MFIHEMGIRSERIRTHVSEDVIIVIYLSAMVSAHNHALAHVRLSANTLHSGRWPELIVFNSVSRTTLYILISFGLIEYSIVESIDAF